MRLSEMKRESDAFLSHLLTASETEWKEAPPFGCTLMTQLCFMKIILRFTLAQRMITGANVWLT